jgi:hypothetical protein
MCEMKRTPDVTREDVPELDGHEVGDDRERADADYAPASAELFHITNLQQWMDLCA